MHIFSLSAASNDAPSVAATLGTVVEIPRRRRGARGAWLAGALGALMLLGAGASSAQAQSFSGNGASGFGGGIGNSTITVSESGSVVTFSIQSAGASFDGNPIVLYLDTRAGGVNDTSTLTDIADGSRRPISGFSGNGRSLATFPSGFGADVAIAAEIGTFAGLFDLATPSDFGFGGSGNIAGSGSGPITFSFTRTQLGLTAGQGFRFVGSLISSSAYRSNETYGASVTQPGSPGDTPNAGFTGSVVFNLANTVAATATPPTVTSPTSAGITATTATLGGNVASDDGSAITERGVVYAPTATNSNPEIGGAGVIKVVEGGTTTGTFSTNVTGLKANTGYSFAAYATNAGATSYSGVATFSTLAPTVSIGNAPTVAEGNTVGGNLVFPITLSAASGSNVSVNYAVTGGTATSSDYGTATGVATITANSTTGSITLPIVGDGGKEPDETVTVTISAPTGATLGTPTAGTGTIQNDDSGLIVTTNSDAAVNGSDGNNTLREAIETANSNADSSAITFDATVFGAAQTLANRTISVGAALPNLTAPVTITGSAGGVIIGATTQSFTIFTVDGGVKVDFDRLTIRNGNTGIANSGNLTVLNSTLSGNSNNAISNFSTLTLTNSTLSGNGTGIFNPSTVVATNVSVSGNGTGISNFGNVTLRNSLVVGNSSVNVSGMGALIDEGGNRTTGTAAEAGLDTVLRSNGGPTQTLALLAGSPAINAGINGNVPTGVTTDQRGTVFARVQSGTVDIGAFEFDPAPTVVSIARAGTNPTTAASVAFTVTFSEAVTGVDTGDFTLSRTGSISGASVSGVTGSGVSYLVTVSGISGTGTLRLDAKASGTGITDVGGNTLSTGFTTGQTYTRNAGEVAGATPAISGAILSEVRFRGPGGSADEYVELVNTTNAALEIGGWSVQTSAGTTLVPQNTSIPVGGHYLLTGSAYSLTTYGAGDALLSGDASDASGVALFNAANAKQDAVGFAASPTSLREGAGLLSAPTSNIQHALMRDFNAAAPKDSGNSSNDFVCLSTTGANIPGSNGAVVAQLGAPNPEGLLSPVNVNSQVGITLIQPEAGINNAPNRLRTGSGNGGTLLLRRTLRNNGPLAISRVRLLMTRITSQNSPTGIVANQADVRLISSGNESIALPNRDSNGVIIPAGQDGAGTTLTPVVGLLLEAPSNATSTSGNPVVTSGGGGLGSSVSFEANLPTPLLPNQSAHYGFNLQVATGGTYLVAFNILAIPTAAP